MRTLVLAAAVASAVGISDARAATNLIKDGGFESPAPPMGSFTTYDLGKRVGPWLVTGTAGNVAIVSTSNIGGPAERGQAFMDLTGDCDCGAATGVAQTIATSAGTNYRLTFWVGTRNVPADLNSTVNVYQGSSLLISAFNNAKSNGTGQVWRKFSVSFVASGASTTLNFVSGDPDGDIQCGLDGVSVVAEP